VELEWKRYRKITPTTARLLTEEDFRKLRGVIQTLEGPRPFKVGDYLARDSKGEWPIKAAKIQSSYEQESGPDAEGWAKFLSTDIREAVQMKEPWSEPDGLKGKAGDYRVRSGGSTWPVDRELFEAAYRLA
jgi:hypothetical protein